MKKQVVISIIVTLGFILPIILFNYIMDPMWTFNHNHKYNAYQESPNERQQKTNKIYFTNQQYDALIIGSSRTTYMSQDNWGMYNPFNFAVGDLYPDEYKDLIDFAMKDSKQPIKTVIIGADFFSYFLTQKENSSLTNQAIKFTKSPFYRQKLLLSSDVTTLSIQNFRNYFMPSKHQNVYTRSNIKLLSKKENHSERLPMMIKKDLRAFEKYKYSTVNRQFFLDTLTKLKKNHPDINFIVYTTPVSMPLFNQIIKSGFYTDYENWLEDLVSVFDEVHHFMYKNPVSINYSEYFDDSHHAFTSTQDIIAANINHKDRKNRLYDFGILLNKNNIKKELANLRIKNKHSTLPY